jgi:hypothetical protein
VLRQSRGVDTLDGALAIPPLGHMVLPGALAALWSRP